MLDGLAEGGNVCCHLTSPHFRLFLEIVYIMSSELKRRTTIQTATSTNFKSRHLRWYGGVMVLIAWLTIGDGVCGIKIISQYLFCDDDILDNMTIYRKIFLV